MRISDWSSDVCSSDLLRHRFHIQGVRQIGDRLGDGSVAGIALDPAHEALVDLDRVEGIVAQIAERGIAGAEIVKRQRSEEPRVGKECCSTCRSRWSR